MISFKQFIIEKASEEKLEDASTSVNLPGGGSFDYVIVNDKINIDKKGNVVYITSVNAERGEDWELKRGTKTIQRTIDYIRKNFINHKIAGVPISDGAVMAFSKALKSDSIKRNKLFVI